MLLMVHCASVILRAFLCRQQVSFTMLSKWRLRCSMHMKESSNESAWPTELVTQLGQGSESSIKNPSVPPTVVNAQSSTIPPQGDTWARLANLTSAENVLVQPTNDFPKPPRRNRRRLLIASALILLLLLAGGTILAVTGMLGSLQRGGGPGLAGAARITITPADQDVKNSFVISATTATPVVSTDHGQARQLSPDTPAQS